MKYTKCILVPEPITQAHIEAWHAEEHDAGRTLHAVVMTPEALAVYNRTLFDRVVLMGTPAGESKPSINAQWFTGGAVELQKDDHIREGEIHLISYDARQTRRRLSDMERVAITRLAWNSTVQFEKLAGRTLTSWDDINQIFFINAIGLAESDLVEQGDFEEASITSASSLSLVDAGGFSKSGCYGDKRMRYMVVALFQSIARQLLRIQTVDTKAPTHRPEEYFSF